MNIFNRKDAGAGLAYKLPQADLLFALDSIPQEVSTDTARMTGRTCISSDAFDRDGDIVEQDGFIWDNYKNNPVVFFNHQQFPTPVGRSEDDDGILTIERAGSKTYATCYFCQKDKIATQIFHLVDDKVIRAASIAFNIRLATPLANEPDFANLGRVISKAPRFRIKKAEVTEWSWVGIGANQEAVASYLGKGMINGDRIDDCLRKALEPYSAPLSGIVAVPSEIEKLLPRNEDQADAPKEDNENQPQAEVSQAPNPHHQKVQALLDKIGQRQATQEHVKALLDELGQLTDDEVSLLGQVAEIPGQNRQEIMDGLGKLLHSQLEASLKTDTPPAAPQPHGESSSNRASLHTPGAKFRSKLSFGKRFEAWRNRVITKATSVQGNAAPLVNASTSLPKPKQTGHGIYKCKKCSKIVRQCKCQPWQHANGKTMVYKVLCKACKSEGWQDQKNLPIQEVVQKHYGAIQTGKALNHAISSIHQNADQYGLTAQEKNTLFHAMKGIRSAIDGNLLSPEARKTWQDAKPDFKLAALQFVIDEVPPQSQSDLYAVKFVEFLAKS